MNDPTAKGLARVRIARNRRSRNSSVPIPTTGGGAAAGLHLFTLRPGRAFNEVRPLARTPTATYLPMAVGVGELGRAHLRRSASRGA
jgi:hypothetical protein